MKALNNAKKWFENKYLIKFSEAGAENFEEINAVLEYTFKHAMESNGFAFNHYSDFIESLNSIVELGGKTFIVKYGKKIVGTVSYKPKGLEKWYYTGNAYELCHLAVLPEYQKLGLGRKLVDLIIDEAKNAGVGITLVTPEKNMGVIKFYEKIGFSRVRMFFAVDHYAVRFIMFNGESEFTSEELRSRYEKSAFLVLFRHYKECNEIADEQVLIKWRSEFYKYLRNEPEEVQEEMRKQFKRKGTTPKRFVKNRNKKLETQK